MESWRLMVLMAGVGFLFAFIFYFLDTSKFISSSENATGTIVGYYERHTTHATSSDERSYHAQVKFITDEGKDIRFTSDYGNNYRPYDIGEDVEVLYDPEWPKDARIKSFWSLWFLPIVFGLLCVSFIYTGLFGERQQ